MVGDKQASKASNNLFLAAKEALDKRSINASCLTVESAAIVLKLINQLNQLQRTTRDILTNGDQSNYQIQIKALMKQLQATVTQNNVLHQLIVNLKDQVCHLTAKLKETHVQMPVQSDHTARQFLLAHIKQTQERLCDQLTSVAFKYNELTDLVHQDQQKERQYLKRLLKHKHATVQHISNSPPRQAPSLPSQQTLQKHISILEDKLLIRNQEIKRLQSKFQYQCTSLAKGLSTNQLMCDKVQLLEQQLSKLENQVKQLNLENNFLKKRPQKSISKDLPHGFQEKLKRAKSFSNERLLRLAVVQSQENHIAFESQKQGLKQPKHQRNYQKGESSAAKQRAQRRQLYSNSDNLPKGQAISLNEDNTNDRNGSKVKKLPPNFNSHKNIKNLKNSSKQLNKDQPEKDSLHSNPKIIPQNYISSKTLYKSPLKVANQETYPYQRLLQQKQAKIKQLQQLLKKPKATTKVTNQTQNINARTTETNNLVINEQHNQYITFTSPEIMQSSSKLQQQLQKALSQCKRLRNRVQELQKSVNSRKENQKESNKDTKDSQFVVAQLRQKLYTVNEQNISLQLKLNQTLETVKSLRASINQKPETQIQSSNEIAKLRKERDGLLMQLDILRKQNLVLGMQLRQTQKQLEIQRREMTAFEADVTRQREKEALRQREEQALGQREEEVRRKREGYNFD